VKNVAVHVGKTEVASGVAVGQLFVIKAEEVQDSGVEIVHVHGVLDRLESELVGLAVLQPSFSPAARHPHGEAVVVVVAAHFGVGVVGTGSGELNGGGAAEFTAPDHKGVFEETSLLEIEKEGGDGLIRLGPEFPVAFRNLGVTVPGLTRSVPDLDKTHSALDEAAGDKHLASMEGVAVEFADMGGLTLDIEGIGRLDLHLVGELERVHACLGRRIDGAVAGILPIHFLN